MGFSSRRNPAERTLADIPVNRKLVVKDVGKGHPEAGGRGEIHRVVHLGGRQSSVYWVAIVVQSQW